MQCKTWNYQILGGTLSITVPCSLNIAGDTSPAALTPMLRRVVKSKTTLAYYTACVTQHALLVAQVNHAFHPSGPSDVNKSGTNQLQLGDMV